MTGSRENAMPTERPFWNPYLAGVALGALLLSTYLIMGFGLGSSSGPTRLAYGALHLLAPAWTEANGYIGAYFADGGSVLMDWMVFEVVGVLLGGVLGAYTAGRMRRNAVSSGPNITRGKRIALAIVGGVIMGFAARLGRGCTSGQALTGGAVLGLGSWIFMLSVFAGGYLTAPLVRRQWR